MQRRLFTGAIALVAALAFAPAAFGQGGVNDPGGGAPITVFKTPPLADSDTIFIPIDMHLTAPNPPFAGWAGTVVGVHILDPTEVDIDAITLSDGTQFLDPFGPRSANLMSTQLLFTNFDPGAFASGIDVGPSAAFPVMDLDIHAKNTDPLNNSDIDLTLAFWNLYHLRPGPGSTFITLDPSSLLWVTSLIMGQADLHTEASGIEWNKPDPGTGHFIHLDNPLTFHFTAGTGSHIWGTFMNTAAIGIEHVPEPGSALLVGLGLAAVALSRRFAARRRELE